MSDQDVGRKMVEESELEYFIKAYEHVTGKKLTLIKTGEKPDFVCEQDNGSVVGVELTKVMRDPETAQADRILKRQEYMDNTNAIDFIYEAIAKKAEKIAKDNWSTAENIILVLQLMDCQLSELRNILDADLQKDFNSYGFSEIWIVDYTGLDAYGDVELFGLYPAKWWGYYQRENPHRKPYG